MVLGVLNACILTPTWEWAPQVWDPPLCKWKDASKTPCIFPKTRTCRLVKLGLSTDRVGSVLDPTRTRSAGVGWKAEGPETDHRRHSVGSVLGSGGVRSVRSVLRVAGSCKHRRNLQKNRRNLQKSSKSAPKIAEISLDLLESRRISPNMVEISLGSPRMSPDLTKSRLDLLKCRRISPNLTWMSPDLTKSRLDVAGYCLICI